MLSVEVSGLHVSAARHRPHRDQFYENKRTGLQSPLCGRGDANTYRGTLLIRNSTPPKDHHRALGIVLLQGPRGALFLMSEVPK